MSENLERLIEAGVVIPPLRSEYEEAVEGLEDEEVDALISVKEKLDRAGAMGQSPSEPLLNMAIII